MSNIGKYSVLVTQLDFSPFYKWSAVYIEQSLNRKWFFPTTLKHFFFEAEQMIRNRNLSDKFI